MARKQQIVHAVVTGTIWLLGSILFSGLVEMLFLKTFIINSVSENGEAWGMTINTWKYVFGVFYLIAAIGFVWIGVWWGFKRGKDEDKVTLLH